MSDPTTKHTNQVRNVPWVLCRAAFFLMILAAAIHTWQLVWLLAAKQQLTAAAEAAACEATLPEASRTSVARVAVGRLRRAGIVTSGRAVRVELNHRSASRQFGTRLGDCFSVSITVPTTAMLPAPLGRWSQLFGPRRLQTRAERTL